MVTASGGELRHDGRQIGSATLLLYQKNVFIVTAKHVVEGNYDNDLTYRFFGSGRKDDTGSTITLNLQQGNLGEYIYLSDKYDLALIHIGFVVDSADDTNKFKLYNIASYNGTAPVGGFTDEQIWPYKDLMLGIDIYTLGFPAELERSNDTKISMVKGIVSGFYSDGRIKCQLPVYGGNSGGPVFAYSEVSPEEYGSNSFVMANRTTYLVGIATEFIPYTDSNLSERGNGFMITTNSGFAKVEPVERIIEMIDTIVTK